VPSNVILPERVELARRATPFQLLTRASERWGRGQRIWVKRDDLTGTTLTGNKVRKLEYFVAHAQANGIDSLITCGGAQSNHARATAAVCAQQGWHCELILRGATLEASGNTFSSAARINSEAKDASPSLFLPGAAMALVYGATLARPKRYWMI